MGGPTLSFALALLLAVGSATTALAGDAAKNPQLKRWLLATPPKAVSPIDRQKAFSYRQSLQSRSRALERSYHLGHRDSRAGKGASAKHGRPGRRGLAGREVFDSLQNSRSEISRIRRATRR